MKTFKLLSVFLGVAILLSSCYSSDVVSNNLISKRKYNKGFHINSKQKYKSSDEKAIDSEELASTIKVKEEKSIQSKELATVTNEKQNVNISSVAIEEELVASVDNVDEKSALEVKTKKNKEVKTSEITETTSEDNYDYSAEEYTTENQANKSSKSNSSGGADGKFILAVILCFLFPALGVLVYTYPSIDWIKVLIAFLLTLLFWLPGIIYALLVVFDVI